MLSPDIDKYHANLKYQADQGRCLIFSEVSAKKGKRETLEQWMTKEEIAVAAIQETMSRGNAREIRKGYTWYLSGEKGKREEERRARCAFWVR